MRVGQKIAFAQSAAHYADLVLVSGTAAASSAALARTRCLRRTQLFLVELAQKYFVAARGVGSAVPPLLIVGT